MWLCWPLFNHVAQVQPQCSIAFHAWQSLVCNEVLDRAALPAALATAAQIITVPTSWEALVTQEVLADLITLDPSHRIPPQATLWSLQQILESTCPAAVKLILVLLNHFQASKHTAMKILTKSHTGSSEPSPCTAFQQDQIAAVAYETLSVTDLLKGTLLLFKLIEVADVVGNEETVGPASVALWGLLTQIHQAMQAKACSTAEEQWNGTMSIEQYQEQMQYSLLLIKMVSIVKQQLIEALGPKSDVLLSTCFAIEGVLIMLHHQEVSFRIVQTGKYKRLA